MKSTVPRQSAKCLAPAMQERQVTIGDDTIALPDPFLVMATQNPIEQEGTYTLPEAQTDRFMLKVVIDYPSLEEEQRIVRASMSGNIGDTPGQPRRGSRNDSTRAPVGKIHLRR